MSSAYPPLRHHSTIRVPPARALALLSSYLTASTIDASLHPDALLTESGPIGTSAGSSTGLTLHNLRRVEAGLKGENLGADLTFQKFGGQRLPDLHLAFGTGGKGEGRGAQRDEEWQDREEFERQQVVVDGGFGEKEVQFEEMHRDAGGDVEVPLVKETMLSIGDKEERKRRKKERRMRDLREKEMRRQKER